jgi:hypothetical protein
MLLVERFEVLKAVLTKIPVFWDMTLYTLIYWYHRFEGVCCSHLQSGSRSVTTLKTEAARSSSLYTNIHGVMCQKSVIFSCIGSSHCKIDHCTEVVVLNCFL